MGNLTFKTNIVPGSTSYDYALGSSTQPWRIYGSINGTADNAVLAGTANYAIESNCANNAILAGTANYAIESNCANRAVLAGTANYAQYAGYVNGTLTIGDISYNGTTDTEITIKDLGLTQTMSFLGVTDTTAVYNESTENYIHLMGGSSTTAENGNVVLSKWTGLEYLWSDGRWSELGLATSYALASHIHGNIESEGKILSSANIINGTGLTIIEPDGSLNKANDLSFDGSTDNLVLAKSGTWVPASDYTLPVASSATLGGIKIGTGLSMNGEVLNHSNNVTAKNVAVQSAKTLTWEDTFTIYEEKYDTEGHITGVSSYDMTMPANPNTDKYVLQGTSTTSSWQKVLLSNPTYAAWNTAVGNNSTNVVWRTLGVSVQPSTNTIKANNVYAARAYNNLITGSGTAATTAANNIKIPAKWTFNTGANALNGEIYTIKIPVAGHDYGVYMSVNNGTNYYPIVCNNTSRLTTHYPVNTDISVIFESSSTAVSIYPLTGATATTTVGSGVFRVLNYYDANTKNTAGSTNSTSALYIIGALTQGANPQTYSNAAIKMDTGYIRINYAGSCGIQINNTTAVHQARLLCAGDGTMGVFDDTKNRYVWSITKDDKAYFNGYSSCAGYATTAAYCVNAGSRIYNTTATTSWSGSGPYTQAITVSGIKATDVPIVGINLSNIAYASVDTYLQEYSYIYRCVTAANKITLYALQKPGVAIPLQLKC